MTKQHLSDTIKKSKSDVVERHLFRLGFLEKSKSPMRMTRFDAPEALELAPFLRNPV